MSWILLRGLAKNIYQKTKVIDLEKVVRSKEVKQSKVMDSLEFGRIIHAEMSAISDAARLGRPVAGANLFCTTFPCHICAKHIVASGIRNVYFLEPYPKSLAYDLHSDSLRIEGEFTAEHEQFPKTDFIHFAGVSPLRYRDLFQRGKRKNGNGKFREWVRLPPRPIFDLKLPLWCTLEDYVAHKVPAGLRSAVKKMKNLPFRTVHAEDDFEETVTS